MKKVELQNLVENACQVARDGLAKAQGQHPASADPPHQAVAIIAAALITAAAASTMGTDIKAALLGDE